MGWVKSQPTPSGQGEPQSVRDAYDRHLEQMREANRKIEEAMAEIEIA